MLGMTFILFSWDKRIFISTNIYFFFSSFKRINEYLFQRINESLFVFLCQKKVGSIMKKLIPYAIAASVILFPIAANAQNISMFKEAPFEAYKVTPGDSFWFIAQRYGLDYQELMRLNPSVDPLNMQIGSSIRLKPSGAPGNSEQPVGSFEAQVADLVNQERSKAGLQALTLRGDLSKVAETKSQDMQSKGYFSHQSPTYGSPFDMLKQFGITYRSAGENIAKGQRTPQEVMSAWMNSSGHRANILNGQFDSIGVGYHNGLWTQVFVGGR